MGTASAFSLLPQDWLRPARDSWAAGLFLAFLTTSGIFYVNIMPALVVGLQDGLGFSAREAGFVAAANTYGAVVGGLGAILTIGRVSWRAAVAGALCGLILIDSGSVLVQSSNVMVPVRFVHGALGGFVVGIGYSLIARTRSPDRMFGLYMLVQFGLGGIGVAVLPLLLKPLGIVAVFGALALFSATALAMVPYLPDWPPRTALADGGLTPETVTPGRAIFGAALSADFLFQAGAMGLTAYLFGLGRSFGLSTGFIGMIGGLSSWLAIGGASLVVALGSRHGRLVPLMGAIALALVCRFALFWGGSAWIFAVGSCFAAVTHAFILPYLLGLCAAFDSSGRSAVIGGLFSKLGLASGPAMSALVLGEQHYPRLIMLSLIGIGLSGVVAFWPARYIDRRSAIARGRHE
jgi:DHA1 family inner membrane transport protein